MCCCPCVLWTGRRCFLHILLLSLLQMQNGLWRFEEEMNGVGRGGWGWDRSPETFGWMMMMKGDVERKEYRKGGGGDGTTKLCLLGKVQETWTNITHVSPLPTQQQHPRPHASTHARQKLQSTKSSCIDPFLLFWVLFVASLFSLIWHSLSYLAGHLAMPMQCSSSSASVSVSSASWVCICTTVPRQIACFCEHYCYDVSLSSKSCIFPQEKALISSSAAAVMLGWALDEHFWMVVFLIRQFFFWHYWELILFFSPSSIGSFVICIWLLRCWNLSWLWYSALIFFLIMLCFLTTFLSLAWK